MKRPFLIIIAGSLMVFFGIIFWLDGREAQRQKRILGERISGNYELSIKNYELNNEERTGQAPTEQYSQKTIKPDSGQAANQSINKIQDNLNRQTLYQVIKVVDGDTIDVRIGDKAERLRLIGINTPETVDPRRPVECFGQEASNKAKELLNNQRVYLEKDETQDERDKYGRLLRYIWREDKLFYNLQIIKLGYAYEYTYQIPYAYQREFKEAENYARENKLGLWADGVCETEQERHTPASEINSDLPADPNCTIKGNINAKGEKIYHLSGCQSYNNTKINFDKGERYFCSEAEAESAGWRKAQNCPVQ